MEKAIYKIRTRQGLKDQAGYVFRSGDMEFGVGKSFATWVLTDLRSGCNCGLEFMAATRQGVLDLYVAAAENKRQAIRDASKSAVMFYGGEINTDIKPKDSLLSAAWNWGK